MNKDIKRLEEKIDRLLNTYPPRLDYSDLHVRLNIDFELLPRTPLTATQEIKRHQIEIWFKHEIHQYMKYLEDSISRKLYRLSV